MRALRTLVIAAIAVGSLVGTASAGGSWLESYRDSYQPGESVVMRGGVSPGQLGWVEDGPFFAYLRVDPDPWGGCFICIQDGDIYLGELAIQEPRLGLLHVSITFTLPEDLIDGEYWVVYCNNPCTQGLGDLIGGLVVVTNPRPPAPPRRAFLIPYALHII